MSPPNSVNQYNLGDDYIYIIIYIYIYYIYNLIIGRYFMERCGWKMVNRLVVWVGALLDAFLGTLPKQFQVMNDWWFHIFWFKLQIFESMDWFKGQITGKPHIAWENNSGFRLRFSLKPIHWMNQNLGSCACPILFATPRIGCCRRWVLKSNQLLVIRPKNNNLPSGYD